MAELDLWETMGTSVGTSGTSTTYRMRVPGGYLFRVKSENGGKLPCSESMAFVPVASQEMKSQTIRQRPRIPA